MRPSEEKKNKWSKKSNDLFKKGYIQTFRTEFS